MKKIFLITHNDGSTFEIACNRAVAAICQVNVRPNDLGLLKAACDLAREGYAIDMHTDHPTWIAPSQIKTVQIIFSEPNGSAKLAVTK